MPLVLAQIALCAVALAPKSASPPATLGCASVRSRHWSELPGLEYTGRLLIELPEEPATSLTLVVGDRVPIELSAATVDGIPVPVAQTAISATEAPNDLWFDRGGPWLAPPYIVRARFEAAAGPERLVVVMLGRRAPRVLARLGEDGRDRAAARVCAALVPARPAFTSGRRLSIGAADAGYFAAGWRALDRPSPSSPLARWMGAHGVVLVPSARDGDVAVRLRAFSPPGPSGVAITLGVNDVLEAPSQPLREGLADYEWRIPAASWVAGTNELVFKVSPPDAEPRGAGDRLGLLRLDLELR